MIESKSLCQQLREQGLKFNDGMISERFEEMLYTIEDLHLYGYTTDAEHKRIRQRFFKDLENFTSKIEE
jgi:hypothetical protein